MKDASLRRFQNLCYEDFRKMAGDESLSLEERVGFPKEYREGKASAILADILGKLTPLALDAKVVMEIGPGCSEIGRRVVEHCGDRRHRLVLIDSAEMLAHLPDREFLRKVPACFPRGCPEIIREFQGRVDALLVYSVIHYVFAEGNLFEFLDSSLGLLAEGGAMLIGDIPNVSKRRRFFSSRRGVEFHRKFMDTDQGPEVNFNQLEPRLIDDAVVQMILQRSRAAGFDAYVVPQGDDLPMANRREDVLIRRP